MAYSLRFKQVLNLLLVGLDYATLEEIYARAPERQNHVIAKVTNEQQKKRVVKALMQSKKAVNLSYFVALIQRGKLDHYYGQFCDEASRSSTPNFLEMLREHSPATGWALLALVKGGQDKVERTFDSWDIDTSKLDESWVQIKWEVTTPVVADKPKETTSHLEIEIQRLQKANKKLKAESETARKNLTDAQADHKAKLAELEAQRIKEEANWKAEVRELKKELHDYDEIAHDEYNKELQNIKEQAKRQLDSKIQAVKQAYENESEIQKQQIEAFKQQVEVLQRESQKSQAQLSQIDPLQRKVDTYETLKDAIQQGPVIVMADRPQDTTYQAIYLGTYTDVQRLAYWAEHLHAIKILFIQEETSAKKLYQVKRDSAGWISCPIERISYSELSGANQHG
jgi:hypothetical protein